MQLSHDPRWIKVTVPSADLSRRQAWCTETLTTRVPYLNAINSRATQPRIPRENRAD